MSDSSPVSPYGSARDLPSVQEIEKQLAQFRLLGIFLPKERRNQIRELEREHRRITGLVDTFYGILGKRNWVFTDDLDLPAIEHVVDTDDAGAAETRLIRYYQEDHRIASSLRRLNRIDVMRPRIGLLRKALMDYEAGRYYSTVLVVLSMMDGFVNDLDPAARQGLHARPVEDMVAWDSVAGHHLGLSHAHQSFVKGFYKTNNTRVTELFRNGIMHGTLVNFDNEVVATKAWNRLFAVAEWADSRVRQAKPVEPTPTMRESLRRLKDVRGRKAQIEQWQPYEYEPSPAIEDPSEVAQTCSNFLESWAKQRWGPVGDHFIELGSDRPSAGKLAVRAKDLYGTFELSRWKVSRVRHVTAAVAHTDVELLVNGTVYRTDLRWVRVDHAGATAMEWESGHWALSQYGPSLFLKPEPIANGPTDADEAPTTG